MKYVLLKKLPKSLTFYIYEGFGRPIERSLCKIIILLMKHCIALVLHCPYIDATTAALTTVALNFKEKNIVVVSFFKNFQNLYII